MCVSANMTRKGSAKANSGIEEIKCVTRMLTHNPSKDLAKERTPGADGWTLKKEKNLIINLLL